MGATPGSSNSWAKKQMQDWRTKLSGNSILSRIQEDEACLGSTQGVFWCLRDSVIKQAWVQILAILFTIWGKNYLNSQSLNFFISKIVMDSTFCNLQEKTKMKHLGRVSVINKYKFQEKNLNRRQFIRRKTRKWAREFLSVITKAAIYTF